MGYQESLVGLKDQDNNDIFNELFITVNNLGVTYFNEDVMAMPVAIVTILKNVYAIENKKVCLLQKGRKYFYVVGERYGVSQPDHFINIENYFIDKEFESVYIENFDYEKVLIFDHDSEYAHIEQFNFN